MRQPKQDGNRCLVPDRPMILSTCLESELRSVPREPGGMETREIFARAAEPTHHGAGFSFCEIEVLQCDNARSNGNRRLRIEQNLPGKKSICGNGVLTRLVAPDRCGASESTHELLQIFQITADQ